MWGSIHTYEIDLLLSLVNLSHGYLIIRRTLRTEESLFLPAVGDRLGAHPEACTEPTEMAHTSDKEALRERVTGQPSYHYLFFLCKIISLQCVYFTHMIRTQ